MPERGDEEPIGIAGIDVDHGDHLAVGQSQVRPGLPGIGGLVHAIARRQVGPDDGRAGAHVDGRGVGRRDRDGADGARGLAVEDRRPVRSVVGGSPDASVVEADVEHVRLAGHSGQRPGAARARGPDLAPVHRRRRINGGLAREERRRPGNAQDEASNDETQAGQAHGGFLSSTSMIGRGDTRILHRAWGRDATVLLYPHPLMRPAHARSALNGVRAC